jgi:6-phosphofructokinase
LGATVNVGGMGSPPASVDCHSIPVRVTFAQACVCLWCRAIVKQIDMWGIDMVFVVGGNGGNAGANAIQRECEKDGVTCSVIGIPKSIDNDILLVSAGP